MTRWAMVADLRRCVGCQTCTAACKHTNATSPAVEWRRVLDFEMGEFPEVSRSFVPVGCMHCADAPCMHVCPSTATKTRDDGIVTIDYELCIGCSYCAVACPYQARFRVDDPTFAFGKGKRTKNEATREDPDRLGVAQKCTFCVERIDEGMANGLTPGVDADASPACANACIADALHFGDLDDPESNVSRLLAENQTFRMHEELGTEPGFHYVWAANGEDDPGGNPDGADAADPPFIEARGLTGVGGIEPWLQQHWDWRAAGNFIGGGTGAGILATAAVAAFSGAVMPLLILAALAFVGAGLFLVLLETGRPFRAPLNVFFHPQTSWMTRESIVGTVLFPLALLAAWLSSPPLIAAAALIGLVFLYTQARILKASKGIPCWRHPRIVPLIVTTGLAEGFGVALAGIAAFAASAAFAVPAALACLLLLAARVVTYTAYRRGLVQEGAPAATLAVFDRATPTFVLLGHAVPIVLAASVFILAQWAGLLLAGAGLFMAASGWWMKYVIVTRAAYNQGFAITRSPLRGAHEGAGAKPGWRTI